MCAPSQWETSLQVTRRLSLARRKPRVSLVLCHAVKQTICSRNAEFVIQIKICAEYRDMLPRPRLVCQEPGLRPIGRSPGVPDKSIFSIFNFSVGLVGNLAELPPCTVPPATVHCYQNEAAQCSSDNEISQHALLRGSRKKHSLAFMSQNWWN